MANTGRLTFCDSVANRFLRIVFSRFFRMVVWQSFLVNGLGLFRFFGHRCFVLSAGSDRGYRKSRQQPSRLKCCQPTQLSITGSPVSSSSRSSSISSPGWHITVCYRRLDRRQAAILRRWQAGPRLILSRCDPLRVPKDNAAAAQRVCTGGDKANDGPRD